MINLGSIHNLKTHLKELRAKSEHNVVQHLRVKKGVTCILCKPKRFSFSLCTQDSLHEREYSCFYKFKKHCAFNVWGNLNKKLFLFAYIRRVMNELLCYASTVHFSFPFHFYERDVSRETGNKYV